MPTAELKVLTTAVRVYSRHLPSCPQKALPYYRGKDCACPKWLYIYDGVKAVRISAKTRYWSKAEKVADGHRELLDPVKARLREIDEEQAERTRAEVERTRSALENQITIDKALDRWLASKKDLADGSIVAYTYFAGKVRRWAERKKLTHLNQITADMLDEWRGTWGVPNVVEDDQMGASTQSSFVVRLKAFFKWATGIKLVSENPALNLERVRPDYAPTQVLSPEQFEQLLAAIEPFTAAQPGEVREFAKEFRALFLLQRTTGMRLIDCLMLPRAAVKGNQLVTRTLKTGADVRRRLPAVCVEALEALSPDRPNFRPDFFLWGANLNKNLSGRWGKIIARINPFLNFKDEEGKPLHFHSHVLRDTFAVELLMADFKLEEVSRLLTHESIQTTERHYSPWVRRREQQLEDKLEGALSKMGLGI